ncbi:EGF-like domain-containing protein 2 [Patella vulgata]|uniref:EGF-like domain-containing protein 2 n=1 Tax=Patella vulgata TaxID=6465 RepID=UPI002180786A|nr:EGF-like domain-containing protein 2 [Patella vulgata]XP_050405513.1 EGF-like domain-containing protein 2 [Patella vulgata]
MLRPINLSILLTLCVCVRSVYFDCKRSDQECINPYSCSNTGTCVCGSQAFGTQCQFPITEYSERVNMAECEFTCLNGGRCITQTSTNTDTCLCTDTFYGDFCESRRAEAVCTGNTMDIYITPYPVFGGIVYVRYNKTDPECQFGLTESGSLKTYNLTLTTSANSTGDCSLEAMLNTPSAGDVTYNVDIIIQGSLFVTAPDILVKATCVHLNSGVSSLNSDLSTITVDERAPQANDIVSTTYEPVKMDIQNAFGTKITPPLFLDKPLRLFFPLSDTQKYTKLILMKCYAIRGPDITPQINVTIIDNGCITKEGRYIESREGIKYTISPPTVSFYFKAFKFHQSPVVLFECNVKVCRPEENCEVPTCGARKKRSVKNVGDSNNEEVILHQSLTVLDASDPVDLQASPTGKATVAVPGAPRPAADVAAAENCFQSVEVMVSLAILLLTVVALMLATLCITVKFMKVRSQVKVVG